MRTSVLGLAAVLLVSCATVESGAAIDLAAAEGFQEGKTTRPDVEAALGRAQSITTSSDGGSVLVYTHVVSRANGITGKGQAAANTAAFRFDANGVLQQKTLQNLGTSSGRD